ncbi:GNAT family N-acetyltransferase [Nocardioides montaniterrae]
MSGLPAAVVVASNRAAAGVYADETGPLLVQALAELGFVVDEAVVRPDGPPVGSAISAAIAAGARVVLTTGGTGLTPTDRTPEVTRPLLDREIPGIAEAIRSAGAAKGVPTAMLSRGLAGVAGDCLVVNLPGSRGGVTDALEVLRPVLVHAVEQIVGSDHCSRMVTSVPGRRWPNQLMSGVDPTVTLRELRSSDARAWREARRRNRIWLGPWDATVPPGGDGRPTTFRALVRRLKKAGRRGTTYPFVIEVDGTFAGQISVNNIVRGSAQFASVGYWIDERYAGRGVMPRAVAMVVDHCFITCGLHRIEICIRPENANSLRVVEKLGLTEVGYAPRFLHIDGEWRDHRIFAITADDVPLGLLARLDRVLGDN